MKKLILLISLTSIFNLIFAQPDELYRGRHIIKGGNYGHPYTTIDRYNSSLTINQTFEKIRLRIIKEYNEEPKGPVYEAYMNLYNLAVGPMPTDGGLNNNSSYPSGPSSLALWAKCNAFVFFVCIPICLRIGP